MKRVGDIIFHKLGYFAGFSQYIINFVGRITEAAMKRVGDIIFQNLGAQCKGTSSYCDFSGFFLYFSPQETAKLRQAGRRSGDII